MMKKFDAFIKFVDIYGYDINFRYEGNLKFRSKIGGISTLLCSIFVIYVFSYFSRDCFQKTNPITREAEYYSTTIVLKGSSYLYGLYITDDYNVKIKDPLKYLAFHAILTDWDDTGKRQTPIKFSPCDYKKHFARTELNETSLNATVPFFEHSFCLDIEDDFIFKNGFNEIPRISLQIFVMECANETLFGVDYTGQCADKSEIDKVLNRFMMTTFMYDSFVDTEDNQEPNKIDLLVDSLLASNIEMCNKLFIGYVNSTTSMDKGFLFQDISKIDRLRIKTYIPDGVPLTTEVYGVNILYWVEVYAEHTSSITYIKYSKIQDVLANLGGIINFMRIVFSLILFFINHYNLPFTIFTETFLNTKSEIPIYKESPISNMESRNNLSVKNTILNSDISILPSRMSSLKNVNMPDKIIKTRRKEKMKVGVFRYFCARFMRNKSKTSAMDIIINKFNKELEISKYLTLIEEVYLMKTLVFSKKERDLFSRGLNFGEVYKTVYDYDPEDKGYMEYLKLSFDELEDAKFRPRIIAQNETFKQVQKRFIK